MLGLFVWLLIGVINAVLLFLYWYNIQHYNITLNSIMLLILVVLGGALSPIIMFPIFSDEILAWTGKVMILKHPSNKHDWEE